MTNINFVVFTAMGHVQWVMGQLCCGSLGHGSQAVAHCLLCYWASIVDYNHIIIRERNRVVATVLIHGVTVSSIA